MLQGPYTYDIMCKQIELMQQYSPSLHREVIGHSVEGRDIIALKLGHGAREVHYNAAIHANEWITAALLMEFSKTCVLALKELGNKHFTLRHRFDLVNPLPLDQFDAMYDKVSRILLIGLEKI